MRIEYLLGAYRRLVRVSNRAMNSDDDREVEAAVADVQLLGSPAQVQPACQFAVSLEAEGRADLDPLLADLRASLRRELLLEKVAPNHVWLRFGGGVGSRRRVHDTDQATGGAPL